MPSLTRSHSHTSLTQIHCPYLRVGGEWNTANLVTCQAQDLESSTIGTLAWPQPRRGHRNLPPPRLRLPSHIITSTNKTRNFALNAEDRASNLRYCKLHTRLLPLLWSIWRADIYLLSHNNSHPLTFVEVDLFQTSSSTTYPQTTIHRTHKISIHIRENGRNCKMAR